MERRDPEVLALTRQVRDLVGQTFRLSEGIHKAVDDLQEFTDRRDRRRQGIVWTGKERRK